MYNCYPTRALLPRSVAGYQRGHPLEDVPVSQHSLCDIAVGMSK